MKNSWVAHSVVAYLSKLKNQDLPESTVNKYKGLKQACFITATKHELHSLLEKSFKLVEKDLSAENIVKLSDLLVMISIDDDFDSLIISKSLLRELGVQPVDVDSSVAMNSGNVSVHNGSTVNVVQHTSTCNKEQAPLTKQGKISLVGVVMQMFVSNHEKLSKEKQVEAASLYEEMIKLINDKLPTTHCIVLLESFHKFIDSRSQEMLLVLFGVCDTVDIDTYKDIYNSSIKILRIVSDNPDKIIEYVNNTNNNQEKENNMIFSQENPKVTTRVNVGGTSIFNQNNQEVEVKINQAATQKKLDLQVSLDEGNLMVNGVKIGTISNEGGTVNIKIHAKVDKLSAVGCGTTVNGNVKHLNSNGGAVTVNGSVTGSFNT